MKTSRINLNYKKAWSLFECEIYSWEEFCQKLNGGKPKTDVGSFIEEVLNPG